MSETTKIEWTHHTASPWFGCTQVDPCCVNCYAMTLTLRYGWAGWGDNSPRVRTKGFWDNVHKWNAAAARDGAPRRIFTSLMDWLDPKAPLEWFIDFLRVIKDTPHLDWLLLTKRPENFSQRIGDAYMHEVHHGLNSDEVFRLWIHAWESRVPPENVWFGFTAGTRKTWIERANLAWDIPAKIHWCSAEPLLEPLDFHDIVRDDQVPCSHPLDWIVIGGESGAGRRAGAGVEGIEQLARQAKACGVATFVKQDFGAQPGKQGRISDEVWAWKEFPATS